MLKDEQIMNFLHYIGITKRKQQAKIIEKYRTSIIKQTRESKFRVMLEEKTKLPEETIERIINYLVYPQEREKLDKEIEKKQGVWGFKKIREKGE